MTMDTQAHQEPQRNKKSVSDSGIIAEWPINSRETARVSVELYKGVWLVSLRKWFAAENDELRPGKHGIAFGIKHLPKLVEATTSALSLARARGLLPTDGG
jgi:hypothetical protein